MRSFLKFNDNNNFVVNTYKIIYFSQENNTDIILCLFYGDQYDTITLEYSKVKDATCDYNRLLEHLKVEQVKQEKKVRKLSAMQEAMKEVNLLLGKSKKRSK